MEGTNLNAFYAEVEYERLRDHKSLTIEQWWNATMPKSMVFYLSKKDLECI